MNLTILDVVKKEVTKLLAVGIIYPISDSQWVSLVQVVPKKSGIIGNPITDFWMVSLDTCKSTLPLKINTRPPSPAHLAPLHTLKYHLACAMHRVLTRCIDTNLVLNFEKCHFMVTEGIVLGHLVSNRGIEVDKSKIDIITSLPSPTSVWEVRSFLGHAGFYRRFIKNFNKIALPLSRTMDPTKLNYTTIEKELLVIVFVLDKFCSYLLGSKIVVFSNYATLRFLLKKPDAKPRLIWWMLLLQEFNIYIRDKKGVENLVADHLSKIEREDNPMPIRDEFLDEQLLHITTPIPWFVDICNFVAASQFPSEASRLYKERLQNDAKYYIWYDPYLWRLCNDQVIHRCILDTEINSVL
ncbi:Retrovirus-related Pol polyprotein, partial [Mucuna pruriens]